MSEKDERAVEFWDQGLKLTMKYVLAGNYAGWMCWKHPDGQWVTLRKATTDDIGRIMLAMQSGTKRCRLLEEPPNE